MVIWNQYGTHVEAIWNSHMETMGYGVSGAKLQTTPEPICSPYGLTIMEPIYMAAIYDCYWVCIVQLQISYSVYHICAKKYENWLRVDKVSAMKTVYSFFPTRYTR